jgi:ABC-type transport system involved in multi-copper enzyme maturation permease subunit
MNGLLAIAGNTLREAARKRVLLAALIFGAAFLVLFGFGIASVNKDLTHRAPMSLMQRRLLLNFAVMAGLYAVNFLTVMTAAFMPVDTLSGEIGSGVMQTVAAKPVRRSTIVLGKWLAYLVVITGYLALMAGGTLLVARLVTGFTPPHVEQGLPLIWLEAIVLLTLSIAGGTRLSTIANGVAVFGLYGLAFLGGWFEQIGTLMDNGSARYLGTVASLIMPTEALWQRAAYMMQPPIMRDLHLTPFSPASLPSDAMVLWAAGYVVVALVLALRSFRRRPL